MTIDAFLQPAFTTSRTRILPENIEQNVQRRLLDRSMIKRTSGMSAGAADVMLVAQFMLFESPLIDVPRLLWRRRVIWVNTLPIFINWYEFLPLYHCHSWK